MQITYSITAVCHLVLIVLAFLAGIELIPDSFKIKSKETSIDKPVGFPTHFIGTIKIGSHLMYSKINQSLLASNTQYSNEAYPFKTINQKHNYNEN